MYMAIEKFNKGTVGFTVMVDENGKPLLYDKEKESKTETTSTD